MSDYTLMVIAMFGLHASRLASGSDDLDVIVWDWQRRRKALRYNSGHSANIFQAKFLPFTGDTHIVSTSRDGQVRCPVNMGFYNPERSWVLCLMS